MKVILTGSTGFIGGEVLSKCLQNSAITSVVALSRRHPDVLPGDVAYSEKLIVIIMDDFNVYPSSVLEQLKGSDGCIWCMGTYNWDPVAELEYPAAFQAALLEVLDKPRTFTYVYLGGAFTEQDQQRALWFFAKGRRIRGTAQAQFLAFGTRNPDLDTHVVKPAGVLPRYIPYLLYTTLQALSIPVVRVDDLADVMVDVITGKGEIQIMSNAAITKKAKDIRRT